MQNNQELINEIDARIEKLKGSFMHEAELQGLHFRYAAERGELLLEIRKNGRFYYWLQCGARFVLINASERRRVDIINPIGKKLRKLPTTPSSQTHSLLEVPPKDIDT